MERGRKRTRAVLLATAALLLGQAAAQAGKAPKAPLAVVFDHGMDQAATVDYLELRKGERFQIVISETYPSCFVYNFKAVEITPDDKTRADAGRGPKKGSYLFAPIVHDGKDRDYLVYINKNLKAPDNCSAVDLAERGEGNPWTVQVRTFGWEIGFAGGFTADTLTDPQFALTAAKREVAQADGSTQMEDGFRVVAQPEAEDDYELGAAAMIHIFNSNPSRKLWRRWAPLTFGLSVNQGSEVRYFFGSSARFGDQAFLTAGIVFGSEDRLPGGLDLADNNFTTNANALQTLPTRTDSAIFVGISYTFLGNRGAFESALQTTPRGGGTPGGGGGESDEDDDEDDTPDEVPEPTLSLLVGGDAVTGFAWKVAQGEEAPPVEATLTSDAEVETQVAIAVDEPFTVEPAECTVSADSPCEVTIGFKPAEGVTEAAAKLTVTWGEGSVLEIGLEGSVGAAEAGEGS